MLKPTALDACDLLGTKKLNTTAYHLQCDGMVELFKRTLKTAIRKYTAMFGDQWNNYISGIVCAYRPSPHDSTGEKPSFLLFSFDYHSPSETALFPDTPYCRPLADIGEQLVLSPSEARAAATKVIFKLKTLTKAVCEES